MKRLMILIASLVLMLMVPISVHAAEDCGENLKWEYDKTTKTLTVYGQGKMKKNDRNYWRDYRDKIEHVVIGEGVTFISNAAFSNFRNLKTVQLPESLEEIGQGAFLLCGKLDSIDLKNVTKIDDSAFSGTGLTSVVIPETVTEISSALFSDCFSLSSVTLHDGITHIDNDAFRTCWSLTAIQLPANLKTLDSFVFSGCINLTEIQLVEGIQEIKNGLFSGCEKLETITIPDAVTKISSYAFSECTALREINIGAGVSQIEDLAFRGCKSLIAFNVSEENKHFQTDQGFLYSPDGKKLLLAPMGRTEPYEIPSGTTTIATRAFEGSNITGITIPGSVDTIGEYAFSECSSLNNAVIGDGVKVICRYAFERSGIRQVTIPASVTTIGSEGFGNCSKLTHITFKGAPPKISENAFYDVTANVTYPGYIDEWKTANVWYHGDLTWQASCGDQHTPVSIGGKAPTCTEEGLADSVQCSVCGQLLEEQTVLPAAGHSFGEWEELMPATEEYEGLSERTCWFCGYTETKTLENLPPATEPPVTEPPVTEEIQPPATEPPTTEPPATEPPVTEPPVTEEIQPPATEGTEQNQDDAGPKGVNWIAIGVVAVVSLLVGLAAAWFHTKRK